jgi:succinate dehydrogenase / fumarate reductase membrane anchor subunit
MSENSKKIKFRVEEQNRFDGVGPKRFVTGAHYGLKDWIAQRLTAIVMAVFTIALLIQIICIHMQSDNGMTYETWSGIFANPLMKFATFATSIALFYHAWIGVRDIWMDYVKPVSIRISLHLLTIVALISYAYWMIQILSRV